MGLGKFGWVVYDWNTVNCEFTMLIINLTPLIVNLIQLVVN